MRAKKRESPNNESEKAESDTDLAAIVKRKAERAQRRGEIKSEIREVKHSTKVCYVTRSDVYEQHLEEVAQPKEEPYKPKPGKLKSMAVHPPSTAETMDVEKEPDSESKETEANTAIKPELEEKRAKPTP